jgi:hypothetical protein
MAFDADFPKFKPIFTKIIRAKLDPVFKLFTILTCSTTDRQAVTYEALKLGK